MFRDMIAYCKLLLDKLSDSCVYPKGPAQCLTYSRFDKYLLNWKDFVEKSMSMSLCGGYLLSQECGWAGHLRMSTLKDQLGWAPKLHAKVFLRHYSMGVYQMDMDHNRRGVGTLQDSLCPDLPSPSTGILWTFGFHPGCRRSFWHLF